MTLAPGELMDPHKYHTFQTKFVLLLFNIPLTRWHKNVPYKTVFNPKVTRYKVNFLIFFLIRGNINVYGKVFFLYFGLQSWYSIYFLLTKTWCILLTAKYNYFALQSLQYQDKSPVSVDLISYYKNGINVLFPQRVIIKEGLV